MKDNFQKYWKFVIMDVFFVEIHIYLLHLFKKKDMVEHILIFLFH